MHALIRSQIQLLVALCEVILAKGELTQIETENVQNALFYLRNLL
jgi:hypothetical protein